MAKRSPELVHLLQLQSYFPQASLAGIVRGQLGSGFDLKGAHLAIEQFPGIVSPFMSNSIVWGPCLVLDSAPVVLAVVPVCLTVAGSVGGAGSSYAEESFGAAPKMKDASTETPTHFVERHIDPRYLPII